ncbi:MAG: RDD family protein, partial [Acidimicrobiia bacterium]
AVFFGFHVLFEVFNRGRTPGKAAAGLRVVRLDGSPVGVGPSLIRNLLRIVDGWMLLTFLLAPIGFITAFASRHSQRLGDLAAGTVVVRERFRPPQRTAATLLTTPTPASLDWDVTGLSHDEVLVIQRYLERRAALPLNAQVHLAGQLAARFRARVPGADPRLGDEQFLEWVLARRQGRA